MNREDDDDDDEQEEEGDERDWEKMKQQEWCRSREQTPT